MLKKYKGAKKIRLAEVGSTNACAKEYAEKGAEEGTVIEAKRQTDGRGRLGRSFFSGGGGAYFTVILRPRLSAEASLLITAAAAVAVAEAIEKISGKEAKIKWVNDIYIDEKKVCGILAEGKLSAEGRLDYAVLGIGVNLSEPEGGFPRELEGIAGAIFEKGKEIQAEAVIEAIYDRFFEIYENIEERAFMQEYRRRSFLKGKTVSFKKEKTEHTALVVGIDDSARLILDEDGKQFTLEAGEVSVKWRE